MLPTLLRSRLLGLIVSIFGAILLAAGGYTWIGPVAGPPDGASLEDFEKVLTLSAGAGMPEGLSTALDLRGSMLHRVVVEGALNFSTTGESLDGDLLVGGGVPGLPRLVLGDGSAKLLGVSKPGRWVFTLPDGIVDGGRLEVRLDIDPTVERFMLPPQQVREALSGELHVELWTRPVPRRGPIAAAPYWFPGGMLLALGIALSVLAGRIRTLELSPALALQDQIEQRIAALRKAIDSQDLGAASLLSGLDRAGKEAGSLAQSIEKRSKLLEELGPEAPEGDVVGLRGAIGEAGRALQAIDKGVAQAQTQVKAGDVSAAALDVERTVARGLEARARLARQVESLRETDAEMDRLEERAHRTTDG